MGHLENNVLSNDNESFDTGTAGWGPNNNCTIARDTTTFFSPPASLKLTTSAAGFTNAILAGGVVLIRPDTTYTVGYQAFSAVAGLSCQINIDWYNASGAFVSSATTTSQPIGTSTWTRVWNIVTSPSTAAEARFTVGNFTATAGAQALFVDDVEFRVPDALAAIPQIGPGVGPWWSMPLLPRAEPATDVAATSGVTEAGTTAYATANATTVTTASFTPADGTLLVAYCSMGNGAGAASSLGAVTDSLGGTWTRLAGEASATGGVAEIWARDVATGASMTATYDPGGTGASGLDLIVKWYTGAQPVSGQSGATAVNAGGTSYATSITTTTAGSLVAGALGRASDAQTVVANASTTLLGQVNGSGGDTAALFRSVATTVTPGSISLGFSNVPAGVNRIALAEILPSTGATLPIAGTAASTSSATGGLTLAGALSGSAASTSSATGAVTAQLVVAGAAASTSSASANIITTSPVAGVAASVSSATAALTATGALTGAASSTSTAAGAVIATGALTASAASSSTAAGSLTQTQLMAGAAASVSTAAGALTRVSPLAGSAASISAATGSVGLRTSVGGSANSTSSVTADLTRATPISGAAASASAATADLIITSGPQTFAISGTAASTSAASGTIKALLLFSGTAASVSVASAAITQRLAVSGTATSISAATGAVTNRAALTGSAASSSTAAAAVTMRVVVSGSAASTSAAVGQLSARTQVGGAAASLSSALAGLTLIGPVAGITPRPDAGTTTRPGSGTTSRPSGGTTSPASSGITVRPFAGVTPRP